MPGEDMLHTVLRRRAAGESIEQIQPDLIIPTGKRKGHSPSVASIYRALAEDEKIAGVPGSRRGGTGRLRDPASALSDGTHQLLAESLLTGPILPRGRDVSRTVREATLLSVARERCPRSCCCRAGRH